VKKNVKGLTVKVVSRKTLGAEKSCVIIKEKSLECHHKTKLGREKYIMTDSMHWPLVNRNF
jgi:hypothetical protein